MLFKGHISSGEVELSEKDWLVKPEIADKMAKPETEEETEVEEDEREEGEKVGKKEEGEEVKKPKRRHVKILVEAPDGRLTNISRGVIKPLKDEGAKVKVVVNVEADGKISE